ncbi:hypothetical protein CBR_g5693 [Chara braunii]|nr:hypothetical protein CBR_g5693 [Chara braunii]|eukprot:GBG60518.1 hypothetical protein CBR_g5693 [Chara braunii]
MASTPFVCPDCGREHFPFCNGPMPSSHGCHPVHLNVRGPVGMADRVQLDPMAAAHSLMPPDGGGGGHLVSILPRQEVRTLYTDPAEDSFLLSRGPSSMGSPSLTSCRMGDYPLRPLLPPQAMVLSPVGNRVNAFSPGAQISPIESQELRRPGYSMAELRERRWEAEMGLRHDPHEELMTSQYGLPRGMAVADRRLQTMQGVSELRMLRGDDYVQRSHYERELIEANDVRSQYGSSPTMYPHRQRRMQVLEPLLRANFPNAHMHPARQEQPVHPMARDDPDWQGQHPLRMPFGGDSAASSMRVPSASFNNRDGILRPGTRQDLMPHHTDLVPGFQSELHLARRLDPHPGPLLEPRVERHLDSQFERQRHLSPWRDRALPDSQLMGRHAHQVGGQLNDRPPVTLDRHHNLDRALDRRLDRQVDHSMDRKKQEQPVDRGMGCVVDHSVEENLGSQPDRKDASFGHHEGPIVDRAPDCLLQDGISDQCPDQAASHGTSGTVDSELNRGMSHVPEHMSSGNLNHNLDHHGTEQDRDAGDCKRGEHRDNQTIEKDRLPQNPSNNQVKRLAEQQHPLQPQHEERPAAIVKPGKYQQQSLSDREKTTVQRTNERDSGRSSHAAGDFDRNSAEGDARRPGIGQELSQMRTSGHHHSRHDPSEPSSQLVQQEQHGQQHDEAVEVGSQETSFHSNPGVSTRELHVPTAEVEAEYDAMEMEDGSWQTRDDRTANAGLMGSTPAAQAGLLQTPESGRLSANDLHNAQCASQLSIHHGVGRGAAVSSSSPGMKWDNGPYASVYGSFLHAGHGNAVAQHTAFTVAQQGSTLVGSQLGSASSGNGYVQGVMNRGARLLPPVPRYSSEGMAAESQHVRDVYPTEAAQASSLFMPAGGHVPSSQPLRHPVMAGALLLPMEAATSPSSRAVNAGEAFPPHQPLQQTAVMDHANQSLGTSMPATMHHSPDAVYNSQIPHEHEHILAPPYGQMGVMPLVQQHQPQPLVEKKHKVIDATTIFRKPGRDRRPSRFVVILRGLPGSGKSFLAKALRDVEVMNGGSPPRIHSMDDYFTIEVEKEVEVDDGVSTKSGSWSKRKVLTKVKEYCYEPEMEEVYKASMFKAFKKTLEEGRFTFIIVDDRNVLVADFSQYWAAAKRSGYEVYVLDATFKDPIACSIRNVHGFSEEHILAMAAAWEPTPLHHLVLDVSSLFRGDDLGDNGITEVEMDAADMGRDLDEPDDDYKGESFRLSALVKDALQKEGKDDGRKGNGGNHADDSDDEEESKKMEVSLMSAMQNGKLSGAVAATSSSLSKQGPLLSPRQEGLGAGKRKGGDLQGSNGGKGGGNNIVNDNDDDSDSDDDDGGNALSGLMKAYGKTDKRVRWADLEGQKQLAKGFTIGASLAKRTRLEIGPGAGYNEAGTSKIEDALAAGDADAEHFYSKSKFREQLRAEQETFRAVLARRRQRIETLDDDDD